MTAALDTTTGRVRVDADSLDDLVAYVRTGAFDSADAAATLTASRVFNDGILDSGVRDLVEAIAQPLCVLRLTVTSTKGHQQHEAWLRPGVSTLVLGSEDGSRELVATAAPFIPALVARVVRLGPRKVGERDSIVNPAHVIEDCFAAEATRRADGFSRLRLPNARWWAWEAEMVWPDGSGELTGRRFTAFDGSHGLFLVQTEEDSARTRLQPTTASFAWRALTAMLPTDDELDPKDRR